MFSTTFCTRCLHPPNCTDHFSVLQILSVLRTALTIELSLGCVLLYYILKCICALKGKGKNHNKKTRKLKKTASHQNVSTFLSETFTSSPGSAYPFFLSFPSTNFRRIYFAHVLLQCEKTSTSSSDDAGYLSAPATVLSSGGNRSSLRQR